MLVGGIVEEAMRWLEGELAPRVRHSMRNGRWTGRSSSSPTTTPTCGAMWPAARRSLRGHDRGRRPGGPRARPRTDARSGVDRRDDAESRRLRPTRGAARRPATDRVPIIMLSARAGEEAAVEGSTPVRTTTSRSPSPRSSSSPGPVEPRARPSRREPLTGEPGRARTPAQPDAARAFRTRAPRDRHFYQAGVQAPRSEAIGTT